MALGSLDFKLNSKFKHKDSSFKTQYKANLKEQTRTSNWKEKKKKSTSFTRTGSSSAYNSLPSASILSLPGPPPPPRPLDLSLSFLFSILLPLPPLPIIRRNNIVSKFNFKVFTKQNKNNNKVDKICEWGFSF